MYQHLYSKAKHRQVLWGKCSAGMQPPPPFTPAPSCVAERHKEIYKENQNLMARIKHIMAQPPDDVQRPVRFMPSMNIKMRLKRADEINAENHVCKAARPCFPAHMRLTMCVCALFHSGFNIA